MVILVAVVVTNKKDDGNTTNKDIKFGKNEFAKAAVATDRAVSNRSSNN